MLPGLKTLKWFPMCMSLTYRKWDYSSDSASTGTRTMPFQSVRSCTELVHDLATALSPSQQSIWINFCSTRRQIGVINWLSLFVWKQNHTRVCWQQLRRNCLLTFSFLFFFVAWEGPHHPRNLLLGVVYTAKVSKSLSITSYMRFVGLDNSCTNLFHVLALNSR